MTQGKRLWAASLVLAAIAGNTHAAVTIYDATQLSYDDYRLIKRLWADSWRTAFGVPHADTREAAIQDLVQAAESVGANGLVNVHCVGGTEALRSYYCYGNAIEVKPRQ